jgi:hypothetical protein
MHDIISHSKPAFRNKFKESQKQGHAGEGEDVPKQTNLRPGIMSQFYVTAHAF